MNPEHPEKRKFASDAERRAAYEDLRRRVQELLAKARAEDQLRRRKMRKVPSPPISREEQEWLDSL
jgi:crotonobetainyl-CoA:carnitine CoA-transferase CaiB-like acyl-CoA transferase